MKQRLITLDQRPVLDLNHAAFEHTHGNIHIIGTWYMDPNTRESEPCMVLLHARRRIARRRTQPCVIRLSDMWRWSPPPQGDLAHVAAEVEDWLSSGALPGELTNKRDVFAIMDAVHSRLRDLWSMPPLPPKAAIQNSAVPVGTIQLIERDTGKTVEEIEVVSSHVRD